MKNEEFSLHVVNEKTNQLIRSAQSSEITAYLRVAWMDSTNPPRNNTDQNFDKAIKFDQVMPEWRSDFVLIILPYIPITKTVQSLPAFRL